MPLQRWSARVLVVAGMLAVSACSTKTDSAPATPAASSSSPSSAVAADQAHNQQDVMFSQHMIPHHQQAVEMSDMILAKPDIDPRVTKLANQIKVAQGPEIVQMQGWLNDWGVPTMSMDPGAMGPGMDHGNMPGMDHGNMPGMSGMPGMEGMMTAQDLDALTAAQGTEAAKLFLNQMIRHHQGAITMAQTEIKSGQFPSAVALAQSIVASQQKEIDDMKAMLATM